jgi:hypothetical protein
LHVWTSEALGPADWQFVLDDKALRDLHGEELPGVCLVAVHAPEAGLVLVQAVGRTREEQAGKGEVRERSKREAELGAAPWLLARVRPVLRGWSVSGDALHWQMAQCRQIRRAEGDCLFDVKANQPDLLEDVALLFREPPPGQRFPTFQNA